MSGAQTAQTARPGDASGEVLSLIHGLNLPGFAAADETDKPVAPMAESQTPDASDASADVLALVRGVRLAGFTQREGD